MAKTLLVMGPASTGKSSLIRSLTAEHPDHCWHLVQLEASKEGPRMRPLRVHATNWAGRWHLRYQRETAAEAVAGLVQEIADESPGEQTIIAFESQPDPILRHAIAYDVQVFVLPPIPDETTVFRTARDSGRALRQILRDTAAFHTQLLDLPEADPSDPASEDLLLGPLPDPAQEYEVVESQVKQFLACPLGMELAARVHLQPGFAGLADADVVLLNTAAGEHFSEADICWQKLQGLMAKLKKPAGRKAILYACDVTDPQDPCLVRVLRRLGELLCKV
jgi:hypothetical protein